MKDCAYARSLVRLPRADVYERTVRILDVERPFLMFQDCDDKDARGVYRGLKRVNGQTPPHT